MIMRILRKVLSCRKNLFACGLVLLVGLAFGFEGVVYAKSEVDESRVYTEHSEKNKSLTVYMKEGKSKTLKLKEGDGINGVYYDVQCKVGKIAQVYMAGMGRWYDISDRTDMALVDEATILPVGKTKTVKLRCIKKKPE